MVLVLMLVVVLLLLLALVPLVLSVGHRLVVALVVALSHAG